MQLSEPKSLRFHPYNILLTLVLGSITALFLAFSGAYIYNRLQMGVPPVKLPSLFFYNTVLLVGCSACMKWANQCYKKDQTEKYQRALLVTIVLSVAFMISQFFAWQQLLSQDIAIQYSNTASYLYLISGLHFMHVIAGIPFLVLFFWAAKKKMKEPVSVLVYFSDPDKRLRLRLLSIYWHFLDGLWIYLVLFFWLNWILS